MRRGLAKLLRKDHRLAEKRRYRRRGSNEQPNIQNVGLSFCSMAFVLIHSVQLAARHMAQKSQFRGSRLRENSNTGSVAAYRGTPLIFLRNIPDRGLLVRWVLGLMAQIFHADRRRRKRRFGYFSVSLAITLLNSFAFDVVDPLQASSFRNAVSFSSAHTTKRLPSKRVSIIQIVRPLESGADTQQSSSGFLKGLQPGLCMWTDRGHVRLVLLGIKRQLTGSGS